MADVTSANHHEGHRVNLFEDSGAGGLDTDHMDNGQTTSSSWDSGVILDTNTVVQMAEFQVDRSF